MKPRDDPRAKRLGPGVYEIGDELHVDAVEICEDQGVPATAANQAVAAQAVHEVFGGEGVPIEEQER